MYILYLLSFGIYIKCSVSFFHYIFIVYYMYVFLNNFQLALLALCALASAAPSAGIIPIAYEAHPAIIHHPAVIHHPAILQHPLVHAPLIATVPASISSHSSTVIHGTKTLVPVINHKILAAPTYIAIH